MTANRTRCGKIQLTLTEKEAILLKRLIGPIGCADKCPQFNNPPTAYIPTETAKFIYSHDADGNGTGLYNVLLKELGDD